MNKIITISREFGSGGREIGARLAKELGIKFYDKEVLKKMAEDTEFSEEYISRTAEARKNRFLPITIAHSFVVSSDFQIQQMKDLYRSQTKSIRELAQEDDCVIIGRCADYILRDMKPCRIFVHASIDSRIKRCMSRLHENEVGVTEQEMRRRILTIDKERATYYNDFTFQKWGDKRYYDLCINVTDRDISSCAQALAKLFRT